MFGTAFLGAERLIFQTTNLVSRIGVVKSDDDEKQVVVINHVAYVKRFEIGDVTKMYVN